MILTPSVELAFRTIRRSLTARDSRVARQRRIPHYRLSLPAIINPTPLPLIDQRTVLSVYTPAALRTRAEWSRRRPRSTVVWPPAIVLGSSLPVMRSSSTAASLGAPLVHPALVLISAPPWRFIVTDLDTVTLTFLDQIATKRQAVFTLNTPAHATGVVDASNPEVNLEHTDGDPLLAEGNRLLYAFRREGGYDADGNYAPWKCRFAGPILQIEDTVSQDQPTSAFTAFDPWMYLNSRPVVNADGTLPGRDGLSFTARGSTIAQTLLRNTINIHGGCFIDAGVSNAGTSFYGEGGASMDATAVITINFQQGCTVGEAFTQLADTATIDFALRPIYDPRNRPGYCAELAIHQELGVDRDDSIFAWDLPSRSLLSINRLEDGTQRANEVQFFLQGGIPADLQSDLASVAKFGQYWSLQTFNGETTVESVDSYATEQLLIRKLRSTSIKIDPAPERSPVLFNEYNLGDTVQIYASKRLRKPFTGSGRVYSIPVDIDDNSVETVKELDFSADSITTA